jgi:hypothetical protein
MDEGEQFEQVEAGHLWEAQTSPHQRRIHDHDRRRQRQRFGILPIDTPRRAAFIEPRSDMAYVQCGREVKIHR